MRHANETDLLRLTELLKRVRQLPGLRERKLGAFYSGSVGFLHFHEDPAGMFADLKVGSEWERMRVTTAAEQTTLVSRVREVLSLQRSQRKPKERISR
jgi:hypothetical protein